MTFEDRFGRPGKGNDKGKVEGLVGYARRNFMVPIPVFASFEALIITPIFSPAEPCPCGSGKKFKHCCAKLTLH
jgi:transposase